MTLPTFPPRPSAHVAARQQRGFSLIELMIALVLGLIVTGAALAFFLTSKRTYATTESLGRLQEGGRAAFELMSRDVREAGANPCSSRATVVNLLRDGDSAWWQAWHDGVRGFTAAMPAPGTASGNGVGQRVAGTDAIDLHLATDGDYRVVQHTTPSAVLSLNSADGLAVGDLLLACNLDYALVFQATGLAANAVQHNGGTGTPGNCGQEFRYERGTCAAGASGDAGYCLYVTPGTPASAQCLKRGSTPAHVARIGTARWYIGHNATGGRSLYRAWIINRSGTAVPDAIAPVEISDGVTGMVLRYREAGTSAFVDASAVTDWRRVHAVQVQLQLEGDRGGLAAGTDGRALTRPLSTTIAIRNREGVL